MRMSLSLQFSLLARAERDYVGSFVDDLVSSDGSVNWCEASHGGYG